MLRFTRARSVAIVSIALLVALGLFYRIRRPAASQLADAYTKAEYRIPMRDGVTLFTAVYAPKDRSRPYPFLVTRTPYGASPYGSDRFPPRLGPAPAFDRAGYIFVVQDVRGRYQSDGTFVEMRPHLDRPKPRETDESTDMYDTVEWLLAQVPNHNGNVGIWGMSYPGFYTSASIIDSHPAIKAASPQAPATDLFAGDDAYHGGALMLAAQFEFYSMFFRPRSDRRAFPPLEWPDFPYGTDDGYEYFLRHGPHLSSIAQNIGNSYFDDHVSHSSEDDYWRARDLSPHLHGVRCAVLNVAGWFDAEDLAGPFRTYHAIERAGLPDQDRTNVLVVGPWAHGDWIRRLDGGGGVQSVTAQYYRERILLPFFEHFLKGAPDPHLAEATMFDTGTNEWHAYETWPPRGLQQRLIYLQANGKLSFDPPGLAPRAYDEYVSDPAQPVPYVPYPATSLASTFMYADQRFATVRPDVLTYQTEPLTEDLTLAGPVSPQLHVSTSGTDADFDVKLIDVFPGEGNLGPAGEQTARRDLPVPGSDTAGYAELVRGEPMRARFRTSWSTPQPMQPNRVTPVTFDMPDVHHTFRRGHRLMIQIQSSWFPLTDLNPQTFVDPAHARPADFVKATERVYHSAGTASAILVGVLPPQITPQSR